MSNAILSEKSLRFDETAISSHERYHYLDNIRALAMFLGVIFHAALAYSPFMHEIWFTTSSENSFLIDVFSFFSHLFRMPLFFLVSGFFSLLLIQKRGFSGFFKNRALRILLPFIIFYPILAASFFMVIGWAINHVENLPPMIKFFKMMGENPQAPKMPLSTMHLWFLFNLFLFVIMLGGVYKLNFFKAKIVNAITSTKLIVFVFPLLMVPALLTQSAPHPAPERFYPELWSLGFYGIFFLLGSLIFLKQNILDELKHYQHWMLISSLLAYVYFYWTLPETISMSEILLIANNGIEFTFQHLLIVILESYISVYMTLYCLLVGKQLLNKKNRLMKWVADSSYWIYLIHLPILLIIQFILLEVEMNMWFKFIISTLLTFFIGIITYLLFVRWTPIGWLLNGRKKKSEQT